jgi:hypothetical protein
MRVAALTKGRRKAAFLFVIMETAGQAQPHGNDHLSCCLRRDDVTYGEMHPACAVF